MLRNYFKTAIRNLLHQRGTTMLNISGLALGLGTGLILFLLVRYHNSFDTYHTNYDRIYRANVQSDGNDDKNYTPGVYPVFAEAFKSEFPEAEEVTFISYRAGNFIVIPQAKASQRSMMKRLGWVMHNLIYLKYSIGRFYGVTLRRDWMNPMKQFSQSVWRLSTSERKML